MKYNKIKKETHPYRKKNREKRAKNTKESKRKTGIQKHRPGSHDMYTKDQLQRDGEAAWRETEGDKLFKTETLTGHHEIRGLQPCH